MPVTPIRMEDLPLPFGPMIAQASPSATVKVASCTATTFPYATDRFRTASATPAPGGVPPLVGALLRVPSATLPAPGRPAPGLLSPGLLSPGLLSLATLPPSGVSPRTGLPSAVTTPSSG